MPVVIECPYCHRSLQMPDDAPAREVCCPGCGQTFEGPKLAPVENEIVLPPIPGLPPPPRALVPVLVSSTQEPGGGEPEIGLERCPRCRARISTALDRCLACGTLLRGGEEDRPWEKKEGPLRRDIEPHRGPLLLLLGRISLCLAVPGLLGIAYLPFALGSLLAVGLGLTTYVLARDDLEQMKRKIMDPAGRQSTETGQNCCAIALALGSVGLLLAGLLNLPFFIADLM
jgi:hypothetical protein